MPVKTKRWNDPKEADDGWRVLTCRYRPRALKKKDETWESWYPDLGPSKALHADYYGKNGEPIGWEEFRQRYLEEMRQPEREELVIGIAELVGEGKTVTLLCSKACTDESRCHRSLLRQLIEERVATATSRGTGERQE